MADEGEQVADVPLPCTVCGHLNAVGASGCAGCGAAIVAPSAHRRMRVEVWLGIILLLVCASILGYRQITGESQFTHYVRGVKAFEAQDYEEAVRELEAAGNQAVADGMLAKARERRDAVVAAYQKGVEAISGGHWWEAAYWMRRVAELSPRYRDAYQRLGTVRQLVGYLVVQKPGRPVSPLYVGHADGGDLRKIPAPPGSFYPVALSADGKTLLTIQFTRDGTTYNLMDTSSGRTQWVATLQMPAAARMSPQGDAVAMFPYRMGPEVRELSPLNLILPGHGRVRLADGWQQARADFSPKGRYLAFSVSYGRSSELFLYRLEGGELLKVVSLPVGVEGLSFGSDGRHLLATTFNGKFYGLTVVDLDGGVKEILSSARYLSGVLSPDGNQLLYREGTLGDGPFVLRDLRTGSERQVFRCCGSAYQMPHFTPDGGRVLYLSYEGSEIPNLYAASVDGSERLLVAEGVLRFVASSGLPGDPSP